MPVNPGIDYQLAEKEFHEAGTVQERLKALQNMFAKVPKHKGSEKLQQEIKQKIAKYKALADKEKKGKRGKSLGIKKEGAATICLVGMTNSGKSTLLKELTNVKVKIDSYEYTTKKPEIGILDYKGIKLQIIEIPAIVENLEFTNKGPFLLSVINMADLLILMFNNPKEYEIIRKELRGVKKKELFYNKQEDIKDLIWKKLNLIKVHTKQPGRKPDYPPVALKKNSTVRDLSKEVHKDFLKKFKFARIWGKSAKHEGQQTGLNHKLKDEDIVEIHIR